MLKRCGICAKPILGVGLEDVACPGHRDVPFDEWELLVMKCPNGSVAIGSEIEIQGWQEETEDQNKLVQVLEVAP